MGKMKTTVVIGMIIILKVTALMGIKA